jgi:hypothetical protein
MGALWSVLGARSTLRDRTPDQTAPGVKSSLLSRNYNVRQNPIHQQFWKLIRDRFEVHGVVTTNYEIMAEQGLHENYGEHRSKPMSYRGGLPFNLKVRGMLDVTKSRAEEISLGKDVALGKMHGSINWAFEPCGADKAVVLKIHDDVRAAVRLSRRFGLDPTTAPVQPQFSAQAQAKNGFRSRSRLLGW